MTTLFINGSPNKNGNTVALVKRLLRNQEYETLHLTDYKIYDYGQDFLDDQFRKSFRKSLLRTLWSLARPFIGTVSMAWSAIFWIVNTVWWQMSQLEKNFILSFKALLQHKKC